MKIQVKLYPALVFFALFAVYITLPLAKTTSKLTIQSLTVPYLKAFVPEQAVLIMPPIPAPGPGSTGKNKLSFSNSSFKVFQSNPG